MPPEVEAEVRAPDQSRALACAFAAGHVRRQAFTSAAELRIYAEHVQVVGRGEASCLAMAEVHGWYIASDERHKFLRLAEERLGSDRILSTAAILVLAIRNSLITIAEADDHKLVLAQQRFKMRFSSFREVI